MPATLRADPVRTDRCRPRQHGSHPVVVGRSVDCGRQSGRRVALMRMAVCLALSTLVACAGLGKKPSRPDLKPWPEIRPDFRVETLRMRLHEYSITFAAEVDLAATAIERQAADSTVRRNAILWRVRAIPEMRKACFRLAPVGALLDAWIFARQMDQFFRDGAGARRLRRIPTRSRRDLASTRPGDAGDRRFDCRVSCGRG